MKRTCKQCGKEFELSQSEIDFYNGKGLSLPKRCKECRNANKQSGKPGKNAGQASQEWTSQNAGNGKNTGGKPKGIIAVVSVILALLLAGGGGAAAFLGESQQNAANLASMEAEASTAAEAEHAAAESKAKAEAESVAVAESKAEAEAESKAAAESKAKAEAESVAVAESLAKAEAESKAAAESESETQTVSYRFRNKKLLNQHYEKHGIEMGFESAADYEAAAAAVITNPNALYKTEKEDGDGVYYVEATNEFVILSTDGYIRTYFNPSGGIDYFNRQ